MSTTYDYPENLSTTVSSIRDSLPVSNALPPIEFLLSSQEKTTMGMAKHLESLASHYDQMANALHDSESGISHSEEEMHGRHNGFASPRFEVIYTNTKLCSDASGYGRASRDHGRTRGRCSLHSRSPVSNGANYLWTYRSHNMT